MGGGSGNDRKHRRQARKMKADGYRYELSGSKTSGADPQPSGSPAGNLQFSTNQSKNPQCDESLTEPNALAEAEGAINDMTNHAENERVNKHSPAAD